MRLAKPFYKLPLRFDVGRLCDEVAGLPASAWVAHPNAIAGNSAVRLIAAQGAENDAVHGAMLPTEHLQRMPYVRQILASFAVVWGRSRLMRLAPHASVPQHADINHHWFNRVRLHIPIVTRPAVRFQCGDSEVHMAAGEAWLFDNWRLHQVDNPTDAERIHLVADTSGSSQFWQFVAHSDVPNAPIKQLPYEPGRSGTLLTEKTQLPLVMPPAEVDLLVMDFRSELQALDNSTALLAQLARYHGLLDGFCRDWRQLYLMHGESQEGLPAYARLRDGLRDISRPVAEGLVMRANGVAAHTVLQGRLIQHLLHAPEGSSPPSPTASSSRQRLRQPVFIVAAPRSGSTLLFETLSVNRQLCTLGGEAHWLVESIAELQPTAAAVDSNRLTGAHASDAVADQIVESILREARCNEGRPADTDTVRMLEKTPKNALRIPFFSKIFPDARFIFLWRDPRENLSSIIEAWKSGQWITYRGLPGWDGPWSLLLPPGWQSLAGQTLEEIAAYQWECTNRVVLDDLHGLPKSRWTSVNYAEFLANPAALTRQLCEFSGVEFDEACRRRVSAPLPLSRYTHTPPSPDKWRGNETLINRVLPSIEHTWRRLERLHPADRRARSNLNQSNNHVAQ